MEKREVWVERVVFDGYVVFVLCDMWCVKSRLIMLGLMKLDLLVILVFLVLVVNFFVFFVLVC